MKIKLLSIGKLKTNHYQSLFNDYKKRIRRWQIDDINYNESKKQSADLRKKDEALKIVSNIDSSMPIFILDERGKDFSSVAFANKIKDFELDNIPSIHFVIGGADGLDFDTLPKIHIKWAMGKLTWPHQMVKVLLMEQLYRAQTIIEGHPYHRV